MAMAKTGTAMMVPGGRVRTFPLGEMVKGTRVGEMAKGTRADETVKGPGTGG